MWDTSSLSHILISFMHVGLGGMLTARGLVQYKDTILQVVKIPLLI